MYPRNRQVFIRTYSHWVHMTQFKDKAESIKDELIAHRRWAHMHPEPGFKEFETSNYIKEQLSKLGLEYREVAGTGIVCDIKGHEDGRTLLIRADIDALPLQEDNDVPYKSLNDGMMHACGHDTHIACLLGTAKLLSGLRESFKGTARLVFQPAEEGPGGATPMVKDGAIGDPENPDIDAAIALHVTAGEDMLVNTIGIKDGPLTAGADEIYVDIIGKGGHGSAPHEAIDPVYVAAQIITQVQGYLSRFVNTFDPVVMTFGKVVGGDRQNIISERVRMEGTLRTFSRDLRKRMYKELPKLFSNIAKTYGAEAKTEIITGYGVGINDPELNKLLREVFKENYGEKGIMEQEYPTMGAEDFFEFGLDGKIPTMMFWLGGGNKERGMLAPNHSNYFDIDEDCLPMGTALLTGTAVKYLS